MQQIAGLFFGCLMMVSACTNAPQPEESNRTGDTLTTDTIAANNDSAPETYSEFEDFFVIIADTGMNYADLRKKMSVIHRQSGIQIDTLGKYYNENKQRIVLSDTDEDEMYRGEYYPRRWASEGLSIEYLSVYDSLVPMEKTMALVAHICSEKKEADSLLRILKTTTPGAFTIKSSLYQGCMH